MARVIPQSYLTYVFVVPPYYFSSSVYLNLHKYLIFIEKPQFQVNCSHIAVSLILLGLEQFCGNRQDYEIETPFSERNRSTCIYEFVKENIGLQFRFENFLLTNQIIPGSGKLSLLFRSTSLGDLFEKVSNTVKLQYNFMYSFIFIYFRTNRLDSVAMLASIRRQHQ